MSDKVCVGAIAGSYGVHGEVRLKSFCAEPDAIADYGPLSDENGTRDFTVSLTRPMKNGFVARLGGVSTKEQADALKGVQLFAPRDRLPAPEDDEYYHADLMGLTVLDTGGTVLGTVKSVMDHGAGDLIEIHGPGMETTILLPFTKACVPTVDLTSGRIIVDPPEGAI